MTEIDTSSNAQQRFEASIAKGLVFVQFGDDSRCPSCKLLSFVLRQLIEGLDLQLVFVNTSDPENSFVEAMEFEKIPHFELYLDGKLVNKLTGFGSYQALRAWLREAVTEAANIAGLREPAPDSDVQQRFIADTAKLVAQYQDAVAAPGADTSKAFVAYIVRHKLLADAYVVTAA